MRNAFRRPAGWSMREAIGRLKGVGATVRETSAIKIDETLLSRLSPGFTDQDFELLSG
jgi:hypothetical protein